LQLFVNFQPRRSQAWTTLSSRRMQGQGLGKPHALPCWSWSAKEKCRVVWCFRLTNAMKTLLQFTAKSASKFERSNLWYRQWLLHGWLCNGEKDLRTHCLNAESQCSANLPFSIRNISNHVVVYFIEGFFGSATSLTKFRITKLPSATMETNRGFYAWLNGFWLVNFEKKSINPVRPVLRGIVLDIVFSHIFFRQIQMSCFYNFTPEI